MTADVLVENFAPGAIELWDRARTTSRRRCSEIERRSAEAPMSIRWVIEPLSLVSCSFNTGHAGDLLRHGSSVPIPAMSRCSNVREHARYSITFGHGRKGGLKVTFGIRIQAARSPTWG